MGTHFKGTATEERALELYIKLARAAEAVTVRINHHLKARNLTISQFGVLEAIYHLGPMHQNQLATKILKSDGNMTLVIDNLVKRGLVEKERDPQDRRCITINLTEAGQDLIKMLFPAHVGTVVEEFSILTATEQEQLAALCRKVGLGQSETTM